MRTYFTTSAGANGDVLSYTIEDFNGENLYDYSDYNSGSKIQKILKESTIQSDYRIFVLHPDETVDYQIPQEDIISGGSYSENYQNGSRRSFSFSLHNDDGRYTPSINSLWINTKISLEIGLRVLDRNITIWFRRGVYIITKANPSHSEQEKIVQVECGDKFQSLDGRHGAIPDTMEIPYGQDVEQVIYDILHYNNGSGVPLDNTPIIYHHSFKGKKTPTTISVSAGQTYASLLLQIADMISAEIFYNDIGALTIVPIVEVTQDGDKPVVYEYSADEGDFQNDNFDFDMTQVVNRIVVVGANINGHLCTAVSENTDPASPINCNRIGYRTGEIINDSNISSDIIAKERADYELRKKMIAQMSFSSSVFYNPLLTVNNLITYVDDYYGLKKDRFLIQSISMTLGYDGLMNLNAMNLNNLPFVY